ncbi:MAG: thrombospondin type 3 repeat-containing protein [Anaerolineae bacterium]|nr:thrombospondin type 3 repeat-containing protein [Anaerolineae bacterium]
MKRIVILCLILLSLGFIPKPVHAQPISPFDIGQARLNGLTLLEGTRYVFILPYNNADALYDLTVQLDLPNGAQLVNAQQTDKVFFNGITEDERGVHLFWRAPEIFSGDLFAPFAFTLAQPIDAFVTATATWHDSLNQSQSVQIVVSPNTLNAVGQGGALNSEGVIPAGQFTFIGDTGVVIYSGQEIPSSAITVREATPNEDPPAELGDFWWCSGLELQGVSGVTVYVPLRKPLPPLMPLTLFAQVNGQWQVTDIMGYVSADGLYAVYDHPGGIIFTGTEAENNPTEAPPAPPPPPDSDGDGFTDDVDSCPTSGNAGFGVDGVGCPLPPPDSDGDGFADPNDACPNAGDAGFGLGGDGCPLSPPPPPLDSDGDGRPDDADSCPNAGDAGFGIDGDGCPNSPPPDSDGDGIPDFSDICPTQGDLGLGLNPDGCPILPPLDTDGDGVADLNDTCPNQGDIGFGISPDGCPLLPTFTPTSEVPAPTEPPTATFTPTTPPLPTPNPPQLLRFNFAQFTVIFGTTAQAQVEITEPFPADVRLSVQPLAGASSIPFSAPSEVVIPQGATSVSFGVSANENRNGFITLQISPVDNPSSVLIANVLVQPLELRGVTVNSLPILPAQSITGTVSMSNPAEFDIAIQLVSNSPDVLVSPVVMPAGATSVDFNITPTAQFSTTQAQITASFGDTAIFGTKSANSPVLGLQSQVNYQVVLPATISTPGDYQGEIVVDSILPTTTRFILVTDRSDVIVPSEVVLPASTQRVPFIFTVVDGGVFNEDVAIRAIETITSSTATGIFKLHTLRIQSVAFAEPTITAGLTSVVRVTLNAPVPSGIAEVTISLNNADVVPNLTPVDVNAGLYTLQIPQGASTAQFDVTASATLSDDAPVTLQAIFPADVSVTTTAQALAGVRIVSFDFGTTPISPNSLAIGTVRLNIPAPTRTEIRFAPADSGAFFFTLPQLIFVETGQTSVTVAIQTPLRTPTARVGIIAHFASQTPAQGVTGFFTVADIQITGIELSSPTISVGQTVNLIARFSQPLPSRGFISVQFLDAFGQTTSLISRTGGSAEAGATEAVMQLNLLSSGFSTGVVGDTIPITVIASFGTVIGDGGANQQTTTLQAVPFMMPESVVSTQLGTVLASTNAMPSLQIRVRGARSTTGGTLQISSSHPEFVIPAEETVQVPANTATITVPLRLVSNNFANNSQSITFTVRDVNGQSPKTVQINFAKPNVSSLSITQFTSTLTGSPFIEARVASNSNVTLSCGNPCYFSGLNNGAITPTRTQPLGTNQSFTVSLGNVFPYVAFSADEQLSSTITAQSEESQRQASHTISPSGIINASLSQSGTGQSAFLLGAITVSGQSTGTVRFTLESSVPSLIPPTFFTYDPPTCNTRSAGFASRSFSSAFGGALLWCLDIREEAVSVNTPVTITLVATSISNNITYTSRKSFTVIVSPAGSAATPTPTLTPIVLAGNVATPIPVQNFGQNVTVNVVTNTPTPTFTPTPTPTPTSTPAPIVVQQAFVVFTQPIVTPVPVTLSISVNTSTRRATISIASTRTTDLVVSLSSSNSRIIGVPSSVTIPSGSRSVSFDYTVNTRNVVISPTTVRITASGGGSSTSASVTVRR